MEKTAENRKVAIMTAKIENILLCFCDEAHVRAFVQRPWRTDDGSYVATNGHIMIVCNPDFDVAGVELNDPTRNWPDYKKVVADYPNVTGWHPLPNIPICEICKGNKTTLVKCDECDGKGEVKCNYGHVHECEECIGKGTYQGYCPACKDTAIIFGNRQILAQYAACIADLPGVVWGIASDNPNDSVFFRFAHGYGVIAPWRQS